MGAILQIFRDASIGRKCRKAAVGIARQERLVGWAPVAIIDWQPDLGDFEIVARKREH